MKKQNLGQFNTKNDVWLRPHIKEFIADSGYKNVMDPYAGAGDLLFAVNDLPWENVYGYDIDPALEWPINDSLEHMPYHEDTIVVTNPPYLAKNSAARNNLESYKYFEGDNERYEDLYQIALQKVLVLYKKAVFIIPETYFQTEFFKNHLDSYTIIEENPFEDTDCPVCVAAFSVTNDFMAIAGNNYDIYKNDKFLFNKNTLDDILWNFSFSRHGYYAWSVPPRDLTFNDPNGNLGLRGIDGVEPLDSIHFTRPEFLGCSLDKIKESSRAITIINVHDYEIDDTFIQVANILLTNLRIKTHDVVLSPFKNNSKIGQRRRRLDFKWARKIIEKTMETLDK